MGDGGLYTTAVGGTSRCFSGLKCPGPDADPISSSGAEVRNERDDISTSPYTLLQHAQGKFYNTPGPSHLSICRPNHPSSHLTQNN